MNITPPPPNIAIVVPCYNEEDVLPETAKRLLYKIQHLKKEELIHQKSKILFIDDGSSDSTWNMIEDFNKINPENFSGIKLSINKGHQNALLCGLLTARHYFDAIISIDADLQDDINIIDRMIDRYANGFEIIYGVRANRKSDSFFKRVTAQIFYKIIKSLGVSVIYNHADYRLMGKNALKALSEYHEVNLFLRGMIPVLGYKTCIEYYTRSERFAGISKYPLHKMIKLAIEGITSFSIKPIRMITVLGILLFCISIIMIIYFIFDYKNNITIQGWASIICSLWGIGGLILLSIGIVGEYIGKIYLETKQRPRFHVEKLLIFNEKVHETDNFEDNNNV